MNIVRIIFPISTDNTAPQNKFQILIMDHSENPTSFSKLIHYIS